MPELEEETRSDRLRSLYKGLGVDPEDHQRRIRIRNLIEEKCEVAQKLQPHKKLLFLMRFSHGYSTAEIAKLCGVSAETVRRRLNKVADEVNNKQE